MTSSEPTRKRVDGAWQYDERDDLADLKLRSNAWLSLNELDDMIELAQQHGITSSVRFLERERTRIITLSEKDGSGVAARDAARVMAGLLREGKLRVAAEKWQLVAPRLPASGSSKVVYMPVESKDARDTRIARANAGGTNNADIARAEGVTPRTVQRVLAKQRTLARQSAI